MLELGPAEHTNVIVTASAFGAVFISRDGGRHWTNITANLPMASGDRDPRLVPPLPWITSVAINPKDANEIWLGISGIDVPHLWHARLSSGGVVWTAVDGGALPHNLPVTSVVVDPADATRIYVGTINGVLVCERCGVVASSPLWEKLGGGLPNVWVSSLSLTLDGNSLVAWTHGRGAWITSLSRTATH